MESQCDEYYITLYDLVISLSPYLQSISRKTQKHMKSQPPNPALPILYLFAIFKVWFSPLCWHVFLGSLPSWSRVRFLRSKFLCEIDKTQCWLDGLVVGWWFGRGWYVAQRDHHLSNNRAIENSNTLESSSKKTQSWLVGLYTWWVGRGLPVAQGTGRWHATSCHHLVRRPVSIFKCIDT